MQRLERDHVLRRAGSAVVHQRFARKFKFDDGHIIRTHMDVTQMRSALRAGATCLCAGTWATASRANRPLNASGGTPTVDPPDCRHVIMSDAITIGRRSGMGCAADSQSAPLTSLMMRVGVARGRPWRRLVGRRAVS
jgi:hypothetical protein